MTRTHLFIAAALVVMAALGGYAIAQLVGGGSGTDSGQAGNGERKILYWVAPMDPNYRRDAPGKSPMGMDLIPVYEGGEPGSGKEEPSLRIDPAIVNNIGVRTEIVRRANIARGVRTVGNISIDEEQRSDVHVRAEGWIEKLAVEAVGESVKRGELLFQIYSPTLVAAQSEYLQAARLNRPALVKAATERLLALGMTQGQIARLRSSGAASRLVGIHAPQSGIVTASNVREGMFVRPADTIMSLADLATVWVIADVFETEAGWIASGQHATMTLPAFPNKTWEGKVDYVYPTAETRARTVRVRLRFPNPETRLKPNMYANVTIDAAPRSDVLTIPQSALIRTSQGNRVILALGDGRFRPAQVEAGMETGDNVEILAGLEAGERVVTSSQFLIDSEASLDAALLRLTTPTQRKAAGDGPAMKAMNASPQDKPLVVAVGRVRSVDIAGRQVVLEHDPVPELNWPSMTMGFAAAPEVPIDSLQKGAAIRFRFRQSDTGYEIVAIEPLPKGNSVGGKR